MRFFEASFDNCKHGKIGRSRLALALLAELRHGGAEILVGIDRNALDANFVVQMRRSDAAGAADISDDLATMNVLAVGDGESGEMAVAGGDAMAVIEADEISVTIHELGKGDYAISSGMDRSAVGN